MSYKLVPVSYSDPSDATVSVGIGEVETGAKQVIVSNAVQPYFVQVPVGAQPPVSSEGHRYEGKIARGYWVDAATLKAGYRLLNDDASWANVISVKTEQKPLTAYNLTVNGFHTYFVKGDAQAQPVWVHNQCAGEFEKSLVNLSVGERVGIIKAKLHEVVEGNNWSPDIRPPRTNVETYT